MKIEYLRQNPVGYRYFPNIYLEFPKNAWVWVLSYIFYYKMQICCVFSTTVVVDPQIIAPGNSIKLILLVTYFILWFDYPVQSGRILRIIVLSNLLPTENTVANMYTI